MSTHASSEEKIGFQGQETFACLQRFEEKVLAAEIGQTKITSYLNQSNVNLLSLLMCIHL